MLQPTRRDGQMLSSTASIPWLREVIADSLPSDAGDDEVVTSCSPPCLSRSALMSS